MPSMDDVCLDLLAEHEDLDALVAPLDAGTWDADTPAEGWTIRDTVSHLNYFDDAALRAVVDPDGFREWVKGGAFAELRPSSGVEGDIAFGRTLTPAQLSQRWRAGREAMLKAFAPLDPKLRIPWFGPDMSAVSFSTARLMETWAHGQDVADALGRPREPSDRLRHIVHIGVTAIPWSYNVHKLDMPAEPIRVEVTSPSGQTWTWGPEDASNVVRGPALDLALVVTQRRHRDDTALVASGDVADQWLSIAQAFAGPAGPGRKPGQFS